jgi:hypothetical protein
MENFLSRIQPVAFEVQALGCLDGEHYIRISAVWVNLGYGVICFGIVLYIL